MTQFPANHAEIGDFMFRLSLLDLSDLRNKYRRANIDIPVSVAMRANRKGIIEHLTQIQFGVEAVQGYHLLCIERDTAKKFCEKK